MVRGKLESLRDVDPEDVIVGEVFYVVRDGESYLPSGEKIEVETLSFEDFLISKPATVTTKAKESAG